MPDPEDIWAQEETGQTGQHQEADGERNADYAAKTNEGICRRKGKESDGK